jgi:hypothetical protein
LSIQALLAGGAGRLVASYAYGDSYSDKLSSWSWSDILSRFTRKTNCDLAQEQHWEILGSGPALGCLKLYNELAEWWPLCSGALRV